MKLHYLANLFATKHYVGSALGLHSRRLQLDQAEAANRVEDAVNTALSSVENGDVTGVAIALNYVALGGGDQRLAVNLRLTGVDRNQNMMVDTGMFFIFILLILFILIYHYHNMSQTFLTILNHFFFPNYRFERTCIL